MTSFSCKLFDLAAALVFEAAASPAVMRHRGLRCADNAVAAVDAPPTPVFYWAA